MMASMLTASFAAAALCGFSVRCEAQSAKKITPDPYYSTLRQAQQASPPLGPIAPSLPAASSNSFYQPAAIAPTGWEPPKTAVVAVRGTQSADANAKAKAKQEAEVWSSVARETTKPVTRIDFSRLDLKPTAKPANAALPQSLQPANVVDAVSKAAGEFKSQSLKPIKAIENFAGAVAQAPKNAQAALKSQVAKTRSIIRQKEKELFTTKAAPMSKPTPPAKSLPLAPWRDPSEFNLPKVGSDLSQTKTGKSFDSLRQSAAQSVAQIASKIGTQTNEDSPVKPAAYEPQIGNNIKKLGNKIKSLTSSELNVPPVQETRVADSSHHFFPPNQTIIPPQGGTYSGPVQPTFQNSQQFQGESFENSRVLALVGGKPVFVGDMMFEVNQILEKYMKGAPQAAKDAQKPKLMARLLPKYIDQKILFVSTLDQLPEGADINGILKQAEKTFNEKALPDLMKNSGVQSPAQFDAILRSQGSSVRQMRSAWAKDQISKFFLQEKVKYNRQVTHLEMLDEYRSNFDQYAVKGKVRWEQIEIQPAKAGGRFAAKDKIEDVYNRLVHGGNFEAIAKKESHGFRAFKGGQYDWTSKGSLVNKEIDKAIFSLPQGKLSGVIETKSGFHIIRVIERVEDHHTPFTEAQLEIKKRLLEARRDVAFRTHIDGLKDKVSVEYVNQ